MMFLDSTGYASAAADVGTTLVGTAFWVILLAAYVALFLFVLRSISRAPLPQPSRKRWIWLVVLAPGIGIILWLAKGRSANRGEPHGA